MITHCAWRSIAAALVFLLTLDKRLEAAPPASSSAVSKSDRVNVRSRPGFAGEVVTQLSKGQSVRVLETTTLRRAGAEEPPVWSKIELPADTKAWANAEFVDSGTGVVTADVLNLRAGPTFDHGVLARVKKGAVLKVLGGPREGWLPVGAPAGSFGYVPTSLLAVAGEAAPAAAAGQASAPKPTLSSSPAVVPKSEPVPVSVAKSPDSRNAAAGSTSNASNVAGSKTSPVGRASSVPPVASPAPAPPKPATSDAGTAVASSVTPTARASANNAWLEQFVRKPAKADTSSTPASPTEATGTAPTVASTTPAVATEPEVIPTESVVRPVTRRRGRRSGVGPQPLASGESPAVAVSAPAATVAAAEVPTMPDLPPGRWVRREGIVFRPLNIASPSSYALKTRDRGTLVNFLFTTRSAPLAWKEYRGRVVTVTGREYLDRRPEWRGIPLLDIESIESVR